MQVRINPCLSKSAPVRPKTKMLRTKSHPFQEKSQGDNLRFPLAICAAQFCLVRPCGEPLDTAGGVASPQVCTHGFWRACPFPISPFSEEVQCFCTVTTFELLLINKRFQTTALVMGWVWKSAHHYSFLLTECQFLE